MNFILRRYRTNYLLLEKMTGTPKCSQPTTFLNGHIKTTFRVSNLKLIQIDA
jgi:hypothetical protein